MKGKSGTGEGERREGDKGEREGGEGRVKRE